MTPKRIFIDGRRVAKYITKDGSGRGNEYFTVALGKKKEKHISMRIEYTNGGTRILCNCKHCSIHNNQYWCTFKSALVIKKAELR